MKELLLSIIVPVYNVEKYIWACLDSIFKQGLDEDDFEVILINDGSTDKSHDIIHDILVNHKNVTYIQQANQGLSCTRNRGIETAKGQYVLFVDSDDILISDSIKPMVEFAVSHSLDILKANVETVDNREVLKGNYTKEVTWGQYEANIQSGELGFIHEYNPSQSYVPMHLFRRFFIDEHHLRFLEKTCFEDVAFTVHAYLKAKRFMAIPYTHYIYRRNDSSIMSTMNINKLKGMNTIITYLHKIKNEAGLSIDGNKKMDETMHACLSVNLWYLSHYTSLYPQRKEVIADLKKKCPNLSFNGNMKQRMTTFFYKYMPSVYISFRYLTAKRKYNQ